MMDSFRRYYDRALEAIAVAMIAGVTIIVVLGFTFRSIGLALVWYDEVASISLAWLTYLAAVLAALRGSHLGFAGFVNSLSPSWRVVATLCASGITIGFFCLLAATGYHVMQAISGLTLVSLPEVQQQWVASVIPISSVMLVIAELLRLPAVVEEARKGPLIDPEIKEALEQHGQIGSPHKGAPP